MTMTNERSIMNDQGLESSTETSHPSSSLPSYLGGLVVRMDKGMSAIVAGILAASFYLWSLCPTIGFGDAAIMIDAMKRGVFSSHVNNHPWTVITGYFFLELPFGDLAYRANLVSLFYGSLAIAFFHYALCEACTRRWVAWLFTAALAVCQSMWWHSTIVENYATSAFAVSLAVCCWARWAKTEKPVWLWFLAAVGGLSVFNHVENGFLCFGIAMTGLLAARKREMRTSILTGCAIGAAIGLLPWCYLVMQDAVRLGGLSPALHEAFFGKFAGTFFASSTIRAIWDTAFVVWYQSPLLFASGCAVAGFVFCKKDSTYFGILTFVATLFVVFAYYPTWDKYAFLLPAFVACYYMAARGFEYLLDKAEGIWCGQSALILWGLFSLLIAPVAYSLLPMLGNDSTSVWHNRFNNTYAAGLYRQGEYISNPNKRGYTDVADYADELFSKLPAYSVYLDDDSRTYYPIAEYYQRFYGKRPDVSVQMMNSWGFDDWGLSPKAIVDMMERSYVSGTPFFIPTTMSPYSSVIRAAKERFDVKFTEFPLGGNRAIYRLEPASSTGNSNSAVEESARRFGVHPIQQRDLFNLNPLHILYFSGVFYDRQIMSAFGAEWTGDDQIFVSSAAPGSFIDLALRMDSTGSANLEIVSTVAPDFGVVQVRIGAQAIGEMNLFSQRVTTKKFTFPVNLSSGFSKLTLRTIKKDDASTGYNFGIDTVQIIRAG